MSTQNATVPMVIHPPLGEQIILVGCDPFAIHIADTRQWDASSLSDRDLAVFVALIDHVSAKLQHEQTLRRLGVKILTAEPTPAQNAARP